MIDESKLIEAPLGISVKPLKDEPLVELRIERCSAEPLLVLAELSPMHAYQLADELSDAADKVMSR